MLGIILFIFFRLDANHIQFLLEATRYAKMSVTYACEVFTLQVSLAVFVCKHLSALHLFLRKLIFDQQYIDYTTTALYGRRNHRSGFQKWWKYRLLCIRCFLRQFRTERLTDIISNYSSLVRITTWLFTTVYVDSKRRIRILMNSQCFAGRMRTTEYSSHIFTFPVSLDVFAFKHSFTLHTIFHQLYADYTTTMQYRRGNVESKHSRGFQNW